MQFSVESWAPEYGASVEADLEDVSERVDATVERALHDWAPITPRPQQPPDRLQFVDGVRRIDATIWIHRGDRSHAGVCASVAAGIVECRGPSAVVTEARVRRALIAPAVAEADPVRTRHGTYESIGTTGDDPGSAYLAIHARMTALEQSLVTQRTIVRSLDSTVSSVVWPESSLTTDECDLVVFDGPLRGRDHPCGVGYVKTQHVQYLPAEVVPILGQLDDGARTPLVRIGDRPPWARWSWYLRLPGVRSHPLAGVVRIELPGSIALDRAIERAELISTCLPRFASAAHKEPRAPQNLTPIAGLEQRLRHLLGDPILLERSLRLAAAAPVAF